MAVDGRVLKTATDNLLKNCARLQAGDRLLILREPPALGYYDRLAPEAVAHAATLEGIHTTITEIPFGPYADGLTAELSQLIGASSCTFFFARLGDQLRFRALPPGGKALTLYTLDIGMLASGFGAANHHGLLALKEAIDAMLREAKRIRVTCPLGSDFAGPGSSQNRSTKVDVSIIRFPLSVFTPIPAAGFSGQVALAGFLVGTGSRFYQPYGLGFSRRLTAHFAGGRLTHFNGEPADVAAAEAHYDAVSVRFGLERDFVHSWHAGIHPGCAYQMAVDDDYERWSGGAFGNPRILHFHTCGREPPGEISWNIVDPTVTVDGIAVWQDGRLHPQRVPGGDVILAAFPDLASLFLAPAQDIGIAPERLRALAQA